MGKMLFCIALILTSACAGPNRRAEKMLAACGENELIPNEHDTRIAVHEAGHVIAYWLLQCAAVARATIVPDQKTNGRTSTYADVCSPADDATVSLAGPAAVELLLNIKPPSDSPHHLEAMEIAMIETSGDTEAAKALVSRWSHRAALLMASRRCALAAIASDLRQRKTLNGLQLWTYLVLLDY